jgi:hypothetical protein
MGAVALVVLAAATALLATSANDGTVDTLGTGTSSTSPGTTSAPPPPASITVESPSPSDLAPAPSVSEPPSTEATVPATVPATGPPVPPSSPPVAPPTGDLTLSQTSRPASYVAPFPLLTWTTANVASVRVEWSRPGGPVTVLSTQPAGEARVCPGTVSPSPPNACSAAPPGPIDYVLRGFDEAGAEVLNRTVRLTIG